MAAQLFDDRRASLRTNWPSTTPELARAAFIGTATYFGTYDIDTAVKKVTHHLEAAMAPDWVGQNFGALTDCELRRQYRSTRLRSSNSVIICYHDDHAPSDFCGTSTVTPLVVAI